MEKHNSLTCRVLGANEDADTMLSLSEPVPKGEERKLVLSLKIKHSRLDSVFRSLLAGEGN